MAGKGSPKGVRQGGRKPGTPNKSTAEIKALAAEHGEDVIAGYAKIFNNTKLDPDIRMRAGKELLDRGYGRAPQQLQHAGHDGGPLDLNSMSDEEIDKLASRLASGISEQK